MKNLNLFCDYINEATNKDLKELQDALESHDWWYMMSDDHRWYLSGTKSMNHIRDLVKRVNSAGLTKEGEALWKKAVPKEFKDQYPKNY